jgi:hypothetical protein
MSAPRCIIPITVDSDVAEYRRQRQREEIITIPPDIAWISNSDACQIRAWLAFMMADLLKVVISQQVQ